MLDVQQPPFLICGADLDEKVASGRSRPLWRGFIRYYNLSFLQGQGQRWLLFAPYFMARKIFDPRRLHLVHMEVLFENCFCGTQCSTACIAPKWEVNKDCVKGDDDRVLFYTKKLQFQHCNQMKPAQWFQIWRVQHVTSLWVSFRAPAISEPVVFVQSCWAW